MTLMAQERHLDVLTRNAPTTFYYDQANQPAGFEYDLVRAFAKAHGYKVNLIVKDSVSNVLKEIQSGRGDMAAAGLTKTAGRNRALFTGPAYLKVSEQVVCRHGVSPKNVGDLEGLKLEVIAQSSYQERLQALKKAHPKLEWKTHKGYTTEHIFERLASKKIDCTIADSHIVAINRRYYPHLTVPFAISGEEELTWYFPKTPKGYALMRETNLWFQTFRNSDAFKRIKERYFGHIVKYDYVDTARFHSRIKHRLPKYIDSFRRGGKKYGIDWRLLAAQAYQESHWNPYAKSPTGVRGMMMLTLSTAKELGVTNRLNYRHSIEGGAKYMQRLLRQIPDEVENIHDRYKFALAAYNIGMGHLYDAIRLGKKLGIDPYAWRNLKTLLPKLSERKYYKQLRYGYARGNEPVRYVTRIQNYYDILLQYYP
jgi:membrane-bound lytic murein transglycosylase F